MSNRTITRVLFSLLLVATTLALMAFAAPIDVDSGQAPAEPCWLDECSYRPELCGLENPYYYCAVYCLYSGCHTPPFKCVPGC